MIVNKTYKCKINIRKSFKGQIQKPNANKLDGNVYDLVCAWECEKGETYEGEFAMSPMRNNDAIKQFDDAGLSWIASGDVEILSR